MGWCGVKGHLERGGSGQSGHQDGGLWDWRNGCGMLLTYFDVFGLGDAC